MIELKDDLQAAWNKFTEYGRVEDYLTYRNIQYKIGSQSQEDTDNAVEYRGIGYQNT